MPSFVLASHLDRKPTEREPGRGPGTTSNVSCPVSWHFPFSGRRPVRRSVAVAGVVVILVVGGCSGEAPRPAPATEPGRDGLAVLVFTRTTGFRHASIDDGVAAIRRLGTANGFAVDVTQDPERIQDATLGGYRVVVFLSSTGEPLGPTQQAALKRWVEAGGGWVGVHAAADAFYDWPWYGELVGAWFRRHPSVQPATVQVTDRSHPSTESLPVAWTRSDEWYDFRDNPRRRVQVLGVVDESSYQGGGMGADHPVIWCHQQGRGRSWYTALGHTKASWSEPRFLAHILGGIRWAAGGD
jgi:type 1 glutamine amidotransferase